MQLLCKLSFGEAGCEDWEQTLDNIILEVISLAIFLNVIYRKCQYISLKFIGWIESPIILRNAQKAPFWLASKLVTVHDRAQASQRMTNGSR